MSIDNIKEGEELTLENTCVKRPGTGEIFAKDLYKLLGKKAKEDIPVNSQISYSMLD